ncbi:MAG: hypothetical protein NC079_08270 [Clostridium sp.]|nr:hypothetical protein [Acetatifactor muris]MCM1527310.1 hypothetical protein [Bacteroides sp.]MCM1563589.1 hypothetical protein [Clostridium sp.]
MTTFGFLWVIITAYCFFKKDVKYMAFITLLFMCFQSTNVLVWGDAGVGPQLLTSIVFIGYCIVHTGGVLRIGKRKNEDNITFLLLLLLAVILYSSYINDVLQEVYIRIIQLAIYIICFICMGRTLGGLEKDTVYHMIRNVTIIIAVLGAVQWLTTARVLPLGNILKALIYNETNQNLAFDGSAIRLYSTFMEPSYFAGFVVGAIYYLLSISAKWKENMILLAVLFIELLLSKSSTGFGAFLLVGIVFVAMSHNISAQWKIAIVAVAAIGFLFLYFGFYDLLDTVIFSKMGSGSYQVRNGWDRYALQIYETSPWFGIGYKQTRGSSIIYSLLGQLGIWGLISYILMNLKVCLPMISKKEHTIYSMMSDGVRLALLAAVVCQVIACPDLDLCTYWFWMYAVALHPVISETRLKHRNYYIGRMQANR